MRKVVLATLFLLAAGGAYGQTKDDIALADCRAESLLVKVDHPLKAGPAQLAAFQNCLAGRLPNVQRRQISLFRNAQATCDQDADNEVKRDPLTDRAEYFKKCMAGPGYIVQ
jgi:hypothetical protein